MRLVDSHSDLAELRSMAEGRFGDLVKAVVDVRRRIMAIDADPHWDEEALFIDQHRSLSGDPFP